MIIKNLELIDVIWYTEIGSTGCIGIVTVEDTITKETERYIGNGAGISEESDIIRIIECGDEFFPEIYMR